MSVPSEEPAIEIFSGDGGNGTLDDMINFPPDNAIDLSDRPAVNRPARG